MLSRKKIILMEISNISKKKIQNHKKLVKMSQKIKQSWNTATHSTVEFFVSL